MANSNGWIGVDLDGTLAEYDYWRGYNHTGAPIPLMVDRVKAWLAEGIDVRIVTARADGATPQAVWDAVKPLQGWCRLHLGAVLPVTCKKDRRMIQLWDDRAIQVIPNTGRRVDGKL